MKFFSLSLCLVLLFQMARPVQAIIDPPIFSCLAPIGSSIATYSSGTHGIPGDSGEYTGSDVVYRIDEQHILQCFCPDEGNSGIQSNWWNASRLNPDEVDFFIRRGWVLIPNGAAWGLDATQYLVKNDTYACQGIGGRSDGENSPSNQSATAGQSSVGHSTNQGGRVLGTSALAGTGSDQKIVTALGLSIIAAYLAYRLSQAN